MLFLINSSPSTFKICGSTFSETTLKHFWANSFTGCLKDVIEGIVAANPQSVADYHAGKKKAIGFLVGQTMKAMKGKADPGTVNKILAEILNQ